MIQSEDIAWRREELGAWIFRMPVRPSCYHSTAAAEISWSLILVANMENFLEEQKPFLHSPQLLSLWTHVFLQSSLQKTCLQAMFPKLIRRLIWCQMKKTIMSKNRYSSIWLASGVQKHKQIPERNTFNQPFLLAG